MAHPKRHLLQILVTGTNTAQITSFYDGEDFTDPKKKFKVHVGDQIGWLVQLKLPSGQRPTPAYNLTFSDAANHNIGNTTFLGQSNLDVPNGGVSPFLTVSVVQDTIKYKVTIPSIGFVLDPDIQSGPDSSIIFSADFVFDVSIKWNTATNQVSVNGNPVQPGGNIPVKLGQNVQFLATGDSGFSVTFDATNNAFATPFDFDPTSLTLTPDPATPLSIVRKVADDTAKDTNAHALFPFTGSITYNGNPLPSKTFNIQLIS